MASRWLVVFTLVCAIGGHWAFIQSIAWVGMVVTYSQGSTLALAVKKTFDGRHPCKLCKFVEKGKESQEQRDFLKTDTKLDFWLAQSAPRIFPPPPLVVLPAAPQRAHNYTEAPPTPPPRSA